MFRKTEEEKVLRDPIHGYIHVDQEVVWQCINSRWFQRLRRIHQLGGAYMVYHTAEHSRFGHSLGVYEVVRRMVREVDDLSRVLSEREKITVMLAALLHDIGHGPYSHAFESVSNCSHEEYSCRIIEEDPEIHSILEHASRGLSHEVADVIRHKSANPLLSQIISGQLDADRMDYLLRDAYFTGTKYGEFDLERILRTMRVKDGRLVVKQSGIHAVEDYIMARYHMYWQVYFHPVARSYECILNRLFVRLRDWNKEDKNAEIPEILRPLIQKKKISLEEYFRLDENTCAYGFSQLEQCSDPVCRDLSRRLLDRDLFDYQDANETDLQALKKQLEKKGRDSRYYFYQDEVGQRPYEPYEGRRENSIWIWMEDERVEELSAASVIVAALTRGVSKNDHKIFYPKMQAEKK